jgi:D-alanine-D-alanine ligase-like ATP-grasp enzyme
LGNHDLIVSPLGQIINQTDFYSYDAKYNQADSIICEMPAILDPAVTLHIQDLARQVYRVL